MSPDAVARLMLVTHATAIVAALCVLSVFVAWWAGPVSLLVGAALAVAVTLEQRPPLPPPTEVEMEGLSAREIDRRSRGLGTP